MNDIFIIIKTFFFLFLPLIIVLVIFVLLGGVDDPLMLKKNKAEKIKQIKSILSSIIEWIGSCIFSWIGFSILILILGLVAYFLMSVLGVLNSFYPYP
jgi:hypothetical protein